jgi:hypothetical protein
MDYKNEEHGHYNFHGSKTKKGKMEGYSDTGTEK